MRVLRETTLTPAPHLTCIGATREQILEIARGYWQAGMRHIVALRGDPPQGSGPLSAASRGLCLRGRSGARSEVQSRTSRSPSPPIPKCIPRRRSPESDLDNLKAKLDAGADRAITQFFFDTDVFLRFRDRCAAAGIRASLVPGILPITRFPQMLRFAARCGASVPAVAAPALRRPGRRCRDASHDRRGRCDQPGRGAAREGVDEFHFYTLNRAELTYAICHALGVRAGARLAAAGARSSSAS